MLELKLSQNKNNKFNNFQEFDDDYFVFMTSIPLSHQIALSLAVALLVVFLNALVFKYYISSKECTRPYILALVVIDVSLVFSTLVSNILINFVTHNTTLYKAIYIFSRTSSGLGFDLYLYPSFFLAVDRFIVIVFPLKFREMTGKVRCFKIILLGFHICDIFVALVVSTVYGTFALPSVITILLSMFMSVFVLLSISVLYTTMVVMIIKTSRQMAPLKRNNKQKNK